MVRSPHRKKFRFKDTWPLVKKTFAGFTEHKIPKMSGALAYYTVFSMGPLLVVIISVCGLLLEREAIEGRIYSVLNDFVGADTAAQLEEIIRNAGTGNKGTIAAIIGIVMLLIGSTTVFAEIQDSINTIWGLKPKPKKSGILKMLRDRFLSFSVIISLGFILLVSLAVTAVVESLNQRLMAAFPGGAVVIFYIINLVLNISISMLIFAVIFKVLPDALIRWRDVFTGAFVTTFLFLLGKFGISLYVSKAEVGSTYGAAGSLVILLVWVYYSSIILFIGAEFTKAYAVLFGAEIRPNDYAVTTQNIEVETGKASIQENDAS